MLQLSNAYRKGELKKYIHKSVMLPRLLIINEIGYLPFGKGRGKSVF
ncbi:hypothetical protein TEQUI_0435 [Taylorella equigenitalis MCE9]|uniref:IstB-like ATP-binding domain-containing protein n=3 Tax=Taylorella equigenitalis TaxID=29575 RepID=A0A654KG61_TAYEM|nr:hypothetical protein TEQUI_0435 [Taylorella equigenitalis MCE9]